MIFISKSNTIFLYFCHKFRTMSDKKYAIVGAGLVGSLLSVILAKRGYNTEVWERRPDMRTSEIVAGRSINLALSNRGLKALELIGLTEEVKELCIPMFGREVHDENGDTRFMQYGKDGEAINSVSRGGLNEMLLRKADEYANINLHFEQKFEEIHFDRNEIVFRNEKGDITKRQYDVIFGTDGAFSAVRQSLIKSDRFDFQYTQEYLAHSYKELTMPPAADGGWRIKKNALHIWPRKSFMMIALPNLDGSFTCTLFLAYHGEISFDMLQTKEDVLNFFTQNFPDAVPNMPTLTEDFFANPTPSLATIKCGPWNLGGKCTLLGDAAHPIVPFYGQGMNAGFEDCTVLNSLIDEYHENWDTIFPEFYKQRKPNGDAVADLALMNFIEMRDLVADPKFILKNKIDKKLAALFPDKWNTMYSMVTFSDTPYSEAMKRGKENSIVLEQIVANEINIEALLEKEEVRDVLWKYV